MDLDTLLTLASCNNVAPPPAEEWDHICSQMWRLDWRDELTVARVARALSHLGLVGESAFARWGNSSSEPFAKFLDAFEQIDASKSDWRDLKTMLATPSRGAKHVEQSLAEIARRAAETTASAPAAVASQPRMTLTRVDVLAKNPKPLAWAIKGVLLQDSLTAMIGQPGSGKSFLAIDMALHVAAGRPWNGRRTVSGPVVYLAGEGQSGLARRVVASSIRHGIDLAGVPLYVSSCAALVDQKPEVEKVLAAADEIAERCGAPRMIVIDTLARSFSGRSENDASDMGAFIRGMDALRERHGAAVLVIHHAGLSEGAEMRARGSSALLGALDVSMTLTNAKDGLRTLHMTKAKDFEEFRPMGFKLEPIELPAAWSDEDGARATSAVILPAEISAGAGALTDRQRTAYDVAGELCGDKERCDKKALARELQERTIVKDRFAASRLISELLDRGSLIADGKNWLIHCDRASTAIGASFDRAA